MVLNIRTLLVAPLFLTAIVGVLDLLIWRTRSTFPGFGRWAIAHVFFGPALVLLSLRSLAPDWLTLGVANLLAMLVMVLTLEAVRQFRGLPPRTWQAYAGAAGSLAATFFFRYGVDNLSLRVVVVSITSGCFLLFAAKVILEDTPQSQKRGMKYTGWMLAACGLMLVVRGVDAGIHPITDLFEQSILNALAFLGFALAMTGGSFGFLALDITERKRMEAALRENEGRLQQAVRVADIGIFDHNHFSNTIYCSPRDREIDGFGPDEPITLPMYIERIHPDDRERIGAAIQLSLDPLGNGLFDVENRLLLPDGSVRWTSTRARTSFEGEGAARHPVRTVGAVRDITGQKQAEEEQQKLATVVAMNPDFIGIATLEGRVVYVNHAAMALVGLSSEEACQKTIFDFFAEGARIQERRDFATTLKGYWSGESHVRHFGTGKLIDVEITAFPIRDEQGAPLYIATIAHDITPRKRAEAEKTKLEEQLLQTQKMESIGRLAGGIAHDFNNLLTVINGYSRILIGRAAPSDPAVGKLNQILEAGQQAAALTQQLLAFSRKQVIASRPVDLNAAIGRILEILQRVMGEDVSITTALDPALGTVLADPDQMNQVIMNLAVNARDAMPHGGALLLETKNVELGPDYVREHPALIPGRYVLMTVTDSGAGMDAATMQSIFEPFFTTKEVGRGTGLGLATVHGIVRQNGGWIRVYSQPGNGTTFKIHLPRTDARPDALTPQVTAHLRRMEGGTILVVEDEDSVRLLMQEVLLGHGYRVLVAANGEEAMRIAGKSASSLDLLLTDVVLAGMTGPQLADLVRPLKPGLKTLYTSGYTENVVVRRGVLEPGFHYLPKPFTPDGLARKVHDVLSS